MEVIALKRKGKKQKRIENMMREKLFDTRFRIDERVESYHSLKDPHASYYFSSTPVKKRLVFWKKTVNVEEKNPRIKEKMTKMIENRLIKTETDELLAKTRTHLSESKPLDFSKLAKDSIFSLSTLYTRKKTKNMFSIKKS